MSNPNINEKLEELIEDAKNEEEDATVVVLCTLLGVRLLNNANAEYELARITTGLSTQILKELGELS
jgi:hypothetical protein